MPSFTPLDREGEDAADAEGQEGPARGGARPRVRHQLTCLGMAGDTAAVSSLGLSLMFPNGQHMLSSQPDCRFLAQSRCGWACRVFSSLGTMLFVMVLDYWLVGALSGRKKRCICCNLQSHQPKDWSGEHRHQNPVKGGRGAQASGFQGRVFTQPCWREWSPWMPLTFRRCFMAMKFCVHWTSPKP